MREIRDMRSSDIPGLKGFTPPDWNTDLSVTFSLHFGQPYFYPVVFEWDGGVVGCGNGLCQGTAGWLGSIVVLPEFRGRGIGAALTRHLVDFFRKQGLSRQLLIATRLGEPVYRKVGFEISSNYLFFRREGDAAAEEVQGIRPLAPADAASVLALDRSVTGEQRQPFLSRFFHEAWVHVSPAGAVDGYYLPGLGNGLIIAADDLAGLALSRFRLNQNTRVTVVPEANYAAIDFLRSQGSVETSRAPRMYLGPQIEWQPEHVYSRGSGYSG